MKNYHTYSLALVFLPKLLDFKFNIWLDIFLTWAVNCKQIFLRMVTFEVLTQILHMVWITSYVIKDCDY